MFFEYDVNKSESNKLKHGIDFKEARPLFDDVNAFTEDAKHETEKRIIFVGKLNNKIWTAIITFRNDRIRIISVRRARKKEVKSYEDNCRKS